MKTQTPQIIEVHLDDKKRPNVSLEKRLKDFEILKIATIKCLDYPSLWEGIRAYVSRHFSKVGAQNIRNIGVLVTGRDGYNAEYNRSGRSFKSVVFYKINDKSKYI